MIGASIDPDQIAAVALQYASLMDRNTLYIRLWLVWVAILVIGTAYVPLMSSWL